MARAAWIPAPLAFEVARPELAHAKDSPETRAVESHAPGTRSLEKRARQPALSVRGLYVLARISFIFVGRRSMGTQSKITPATRSLRSRLKWARGRIFINIGGPNGAIRTLCVRG